MLEKDLSASFTRESSSAASVTELEGKLAVAEEARDALQPRRRPSDEWALQLRHEVARAEVLPQESARAELAKARLFTQWNADAMPRTGSSSFLSHLRRQPRQIGSLRPALLMRMPSSWHGLGQVQPGQGTAAQLSH
jgi:hypothetical protein